MFRRIAPQRAQDSDGTIVQVGSRYTVQYLHGEILAEIKVDFGPITGIYPDTLVLLKGGNGNLASTADKERILLQIKQGLECLGINYEVCQGGG